MREQFQKAPYNHLIKNLNICNIPLSESEEYDIWLILSIRMAYLGLTVTRMKCQFYPVIYKKHMFQ